MQRLTDAIAPYKEFMDEVKRHPMPDTPGLGDTAPRCGWKRQVFYHDADESTYHRSRACAA